MLIRVHSHWEQLTRQGYTVVTGAIDPPRLQAAQAAARRLNEIHPDGGWERTRNELWREVRYCRDADFMAIVSTALDPLALEILESAPPIDFVQLASTMPGFETRGGIGRNFHIDGGKEHGVFNMEVAEVEAQKPEAFTSQRASRRAMPTNSWCAVLVGSRNSASEYASASRLRRANSRMRWRRFSCNSASAMRRIVERVHDLNNGL